MLMVFTLLLLLRGGQETGIPAQGTLSFLYCASPPNRGHVGHQQDNKGHVGIEQNKAHVAGKNQQ